ncbi:pre-rRNA-processing protein TSR1 homolog [Hoplias malabaricus]|uniref:pre-rRNA-processing protein TSR1 homolog n=1 Tax=Hoplias malabaricus TaxID=27720 RepID=UPI003462B586
MVAGTEQQQQAHRPGVYKQKNKQHKHGKHRTKGEIERENKGRVAVVALSKKQRRELRKMDRRNKANQLRRNKKDMVLTEKRRLGSRDGPPHLVVVISLHTAVDTGTAMQLLKSEGILHEDQGVRGAKDSFSLVLPRFKQRFTFYHSDTADLHSLLDVAKVADTLVFVLESTEGWDSYGEYCLSCLFAQGLPSHALVCHGIADMAVKKRAESRRALSRLAQARFPEARLFPLDSEQDALLLLRHLGAQKQRKLAFRSRRSHLLVQNASYTPNSVQDNTGAPSTGLGTLRVSGYVRGCPLQVNRLVHIAGHGDYQLSQIDAPRDPLPIINSAPRSARPAKGGDVEMMDGSVGDVNGAGGEVRVLMKSDPSQRESLQAEAEVDPMDGEQTWPTESELQEAEEARKSRKVMKVPKGTSDYQAAWIVDDDDDDDDEDNENSEEPDMDSCDDDDDDVDDLMEDGDNESQDGEAASGNEDEEEEEEEEINSTDRVGAEQKYDEAMNVAEEEDGLKRYREARSHEMFPDEVDTPTDMPAKTRFQRYRGLKSFRSSPWDPMENLPFNYSRIFQFQNFERTRHRVLTEAAAEEEGAMVGWYVTLHIQDVPPTVIESFQEGKPLVLVSLLPHEQKMSVMHVLVKRHPSFSEPIPSKEELIFQCGFRRFRASAIFSQHTSGDKHKMERFLCVDAPTVVSVYAPITFPTAGVLLFKQRANGMQDLVATGSLLSCDPRRVVLKRIVLSGHPFKINRRSAVVRYMFFNRDDILWFKPVELRTKWGRRGHIKEALGTHGHMKCVFDSQLRSQDTVLMNLYKRVYPRWTYDPYVPHPVPWVKNEEPENLHDIDME